MTNLEQQFKEAVQYVQTAQGNFKPSNELQLKLYSLYKQASGGDVNGKKPGMLDLVGKAKYAAWEKLKGMPTEEAMQAYVDKVNELRAKHG